MDKVYQAMEDISVLPAHFPVSGVGLLPVNAFVIKAKEPVLVDSGMGIDSEEFLKGLKSVIDPKDLKWIWLTHDDADHTGNLQQILAEAPNARLVAFSLAILRMSTAWPVPMERVYWLNPGESISAGDSNLTAVRPPLFDNPTTIGIYDDKSDAFFSADCFGAIIPSPAQRSDEIDETALMQGMIGWASLDSPWAHMVKAGDFDKALDRIRRINPKRIFSAHLPPATDKVDKFLKLLATVPPSSPSVAPNQQALEQILAQVKG